MDDYADDYADGARVDGATRLIERMEMQFTYSLVTRATALDKLETLVYERGAGALDATLMGGLVAFQRLYETQIESTNRMAMMAARSNLVQVQQAAKEKANADERVSADTRKHELQRSEWHAEKAALRAQLELATAANESYEAAAEKSKTRLLVRNHEYRQLQRELDAQQAAAAVQKAEADQRAQELQRELHVAHNKQAAAKNQLTALRLEARPQQLAAPTTNASASARTNAARPGRPKSQSSGRRGTSGRTPERRRQRRSRPREGPSTGPDALHHSV